jgi:hypothetical protein
MEIKGRKGEGLKIGTGKENGKVKGGKRERSRVEKGEREV